MRRRFGVKYVTFPAWPAVVWLGLIGLPLARVQSAAAGPSGATCAPIAQRAAGVQLERSLSCLAAAKLRGGPVDPACLDRAELASTGKIAHGAGSCRGDGATAARSIEQCVATIADEFPDRGRCSARKVRATRAAVAPIGELLGALTPTTHGRASSWSEGLSHLCEAFERAGGCAGDCARVQESVAGCWRTLMDDLGPAPGGCDMPAPGARDQVVLFGSYEGDALSSATVVGQDEETTTSRVVIEPGVDPLYVVLSSFEGTIWRFEGATSRVARVVLVGWRAQGVTGVASERVTDLTQPAGSPGETPCFGYFYAAESSEGITARRAVERSLGRGVDVFGGQYSAGTVSLPAAVAEPSVTPPPPRGLDPEVYAVATWFSPGGLVEIDPAGVVPAGRAAAYDILPQEMGLAQLVGSGALEVRGDVSYLATYRITRSIPRFPAGLAGAHAVTFILGRGLPMPAGDPGHSCVLSEQTGLPLVNEFLCGLFGGGPP